MRPRVDLFAEYRAGMLQLGKTGIVVEQFGLGGTKSASAILIVFSLPPLLASSAGAHFAICQAVTLREDKHLRIAHGDPGDMLDRNAIT